MAGRIIAMARVGTTSAGIGLERRGGSDAGVEVQARQNVTPGPRLRRRPSRPLSP